MRNSVGRSICICLAVWSVSLITQRAAVAQLAGDMNCDMSFDVLDVAPFVTALSDPNAYGAMYVCPILNGDMNTDGFVDGDDIQPFLENIGASPVFTSELASRTLNEYPHAEFVRAFNGPHKVFCSVDPSRWPQLVGVTADIYIVEAKDDATWTTDPSLVDVTVGGATMFTFVGTDIQSNTVEIAAQNELNSDAGTGLGVAYDMIVDANRNGVLDGGDLIDGLGDPEAGFYVIKDLTTPGPLAVTQIEYSGGSFLGQRTYFPSNIASLAPRPLVVISHGNGHQFTWYDYLGQHLASYGLVVMSHQNNTVPGIETSADTTLSNTEFFLANLNTIGGGVLNNKVNANLIIWIGHSRGGEGVVRAYDRIVDGTYVPTNFTQSAIKLVASIAPTDFLGTNSANPHDVNYHLLYGSADGDVSGTPQSSIAQSFGVYERSTGTHGSTYVHGADHNDFNCCGFNDFAGPFGTEIGRTEAQQVAKALFIALARRYFNGNVPAKDYLWRQNERLKPIGVASTTIIVNDYIETGAPGDLVIDDFDTNSSTSLASSGAGINTNVSNIVELRSDDLNGDFTWNSGDQMNGMTRATASDTQNCVVFDYSLNRIMTFLLLPAQQDFTQYKYVQLRACQMTRHPETAAEIGNVTFSVNLVDLDGNESTINIGAYGGGIEEPYQRSGDGAGIGWQNEFEVIRIPIDMFRTNGVNIDLTRIDRLRLRFGPAWGSTRARLGLDDVRLTGD